MGDKIDAKPTQNRFLIKSKTSIKRGTIGEFDRLLVVLNVVDSSPIGHPNKIPVSHRLAGIFVVVSANPISTQINIKQKNVLAPAKETI